LLGELRKSIFSEFLLKKYFFFFFLHWDEVTRNFFQQLLVFKVLRFRYSYLATETGLLNQQLISRTGELFAEQETAQDQATFGKILCYIQMIKDQVSQPNTLTFFPKNLEVYSRRSLAEWKYFKRKSDTFTGTDWKLVPMALIEPRGNIPPPRALEGSD